MPPRTPIATIGVERLIEMDINPAFDSHRHLAWPYAAIALHVDCIGGMKD
jgi:hypothetical protein